MLKLEERIFHRAWVELCPSEKSEACDTVCALIGCRCSITFTILGKHVGDLLLIKEKTIKKAIFLVWEK